MDIIAYTSPGCFYCDQLKELLKRAGLEYELIVNETEQQRMDFATKFPHVAGYPFVIIDGEEVGGLVNVAKLFLQKGLVSSNKKGNIQIDTQVFQTNIDNEKF